MSSAADLTGRILRHERAIVAGAIALLVALSWWFLASGAGMRAAMPMTAPPYPALVLMWWLMMAAMMLPSAAPAILLYARVREQRRDPGAIAQPWIFLIGYLAVWLAFSAVAAAAQQWLPGALITLDRRWFAGALLITAGAYQLSPLKRACLHQCRSPAQFVSRHWRPRIAGAVRLGILHGAYCVGCCWLLMVLLFVGGVMNFAWIAALTLVVGIEKLAPHGEWIGRTAGVALIAWGIVKIAGV